MAPSTSTGAVVDPTKPAKYPVVLSDALLGKNSKEVYTGVRYNHRPNDLAPSSARIKPSSSGSGDTFELAFREANGSKYGYSGTRDASGKQYILVFDPARKVMVLHRLDSLFNVNLVSTPTNSDPISLKDLHPHLVSMTPKQADPPPAPATTPAPVKKPPKPKAGASSVLRANPTKKKAPAAASAVVTDKKDDGGAGSSATTASAKKKEPAIKKAAPSATTPTPTQKKQQGAAPITLALPTVPAKPLAPPIPAKSKKTVEDDDDDDEDSDDDGGLLVEYPGGKAPGSRPRTDFSPAFPPQIRRFSDFIQANEEDAEGDTDEDSYEAEEPDATVEPFKLPSPVKDNNIANDSNNDDNNNNSNTHHHNAADDASDDDGAGDDFDEGDLVAALEQELEGGLDEDVPTPDDESDISEED